MLIGIAALIVIGVLLYTVFVREEDLPKPEPVNPFQYLNETKARVYGNLRDLQFEFRLGKLSEDDYARTKKDLQGELAKVLSDTDQLKQKLGVQVANVSPAAKNPSRAKSAAACPHCGAKFKENLKFCGQCGKPMEAA